MIVRDGRKLFTVAEVSRACNVSRTTLIRLEESGFLKPYRVDPVTGYRYYDANNTVEIGRYKRLQAMGMTRAEIADFYHERIDTDSFIEAQRQKLNELQHFVNEYELRHHHRNYLHAMVTLPEMTCYCEDYSPSSFREAEVSAYRIYEKVIAEGYCVIFNQPPLLISDDWRVLSADSPSGCLFTLCVPVKPDPKQSQNKELRRFPMHEALSTSGFGAYSILADLFKDQQTELSKRGLEAASPARLIVLATNDSTPEQYIFESFVPVRRLS